MAYLETTEIEMVLYSHALNEITDGDNQIILQAIAAAIEEAKSYLSQRYDFNAIFTAQGDNRNALILENTKIITVWNIIKLSNAETIYEMWRDRYDRVIDYFKQVAAEKIFPDIPRIADADGETDSRIKAGSNTKFEHSF
ncbi:MAG: DUF1320 family protein [Prevotellaceae bacterium]|jgi:phage gp36-like protein|nr:DUF1320 family protein [Prevotellaceae bacterium]